MMNRIIHIQAACQWLKVFVNNFSNAIAVLLLYRINNLIKLQMQYLAYYAVLRIQSA